MLAAAARTCLETLECAGRWRSETGEHAARDAQDSPYRMMAVAYGQALSASPA